MRAIADSSFIRYVKRDHNRRLHHVITALFSYYRPYKGLFILDFSCAILVALIELAFPIVLNKVIDDILPDGEIKWIIMASLLLFGLYILTPFFILSFRIGDICWALI